VSCCYLDQNVVFILSSFRSPGFSLSLVAESTTSVLYAAEAVGSGGDIPEDVGLLAAKLLYNEIHLSGCIDSQFQWVPILLAALGPEDVSRFRLGQLTHFS
jgi:RNA 3'-terminal phosphate cyclase-like protein